MNIYSIYAIIGANHKFKKNYILSVHDQGIFLPIEKINNIKFLHNEIRYNIKNMFYDKTSDLVQHINLSYTEVQHPLALRYIDSINNNNNIYTENDLFILTGLVLDQNHESKLSWQEFYFKKDIKNISIIDNIIDFTIEKTVL